MKRTINPKACFYYNGGIDSEFVGFLTDVLSNVITKKPKSVLFFLNSEGGCAEAEKQALGLIKELERVTQFTIVNSGICNSAGFTIYMAAERRAAFEKATFIWHQSRYVFKDGISFSLDELRKIIFEAVDDDYKFFEKIEEFVTDEQQARFLNAEDVLITYEEAVRQKIVNCKYII